MIPRDCITKWRKQAPWIRDFHVEQDLVIARTLVEMFSHPVLEERRANEVRHILNWTMRQPTLAALQMHSANTGQFRT